MQIWDAFNGVWDLVPIGVKAENFCSHCSTKQRSKFFLISVFC